MLAEEKRVAFKRHSWKQIANSCGSTCEVVIHGTPAGGCGRFGWLLKNFVVVAICFDAAHAAERKESTLTRLKDALLCADGMFGHADLAKRAAVLAVETKTPQKRKSQEVGACCPNIASLFILEGRKLTLMQHARTSDHKPVKSAMEVNLGTASRTSCNILSTKKLQADMIFCLQAMTRRCLA